MDSEAENQPAVIRFIHEAPLHSSREPSASTTSESGLLDLALDPFDALAKDLFGFIPVSLDAHHT